MNCLYDMKNRISLIVSAALLIAGCSGSEEASDLAYRDEALLKAGMIYYGQDPQAENFDDMYYAFAAKEAELTAASETASREFKAQVKAMPSKDRNYLKDVFEDIADLAVLADYSYKDSAVELPKGWIDLGKQHPEIENIFSRQSKSKFMPMGLKCSLMSKGERKVLVFAGTDFPSTWKGYDQVMHFLVDAYEDVYGALKSDATQVVFAGKIVDELLEEGYVTKEDLEFAGHSLGGRLASEMSVRYGCPAVIFNAAGVSPEVYQNYEKSKEEAGEDWRGYIINVVSANDPLTCAQRYMSGSTDPLKTKLANVISSDKKTVDKYVSIGLDLIGTVVDKVAGDSKAASTVKDIVEEYGEDVERLYRRDYRAIGAVMPIRENLAGHGIKELAASLRTRSEICD